MEKKIIVFAPHPDDETLACGGTIVEKLNKGYNVVIIFMTDGRNAFSELFQIFSDPTPQELKEIRCKEAKKSTGILGVPKEELIFLEIEDGMLERKEKEGQKRVVEILSKEHPAEIYYPHKSEAHKDHRSTYNIVRNSIKSLNFHPAEYRYELSPKSNLLTRYASILDSRTLIRVNISKYLSLKKRALEAYESQISIISPMQKQPVLNASLLEKFLADSEKFLVG
jgi:LmbE family N-acetylglucosaminyl deacetylase